MLFSFALYNLQYLKPTGQINNFRSSMRKQKPDIPKTSRSKQLSQTKNNLIKTKNLKFYKSIEKAQHLKDSQYLFKVSIPKELKPLHPSNDKEIVMKFQKPSWAKRSKDERVVDLGKKINSDEESTHANGLFESGQIYQNFIHKSRPQPRKQPKTQQQLHVPKKRKASQQQSLQQVLKNRIAEYKLLQKRHDQEMDQYRSKISNGQIHRLQKIHSIQKFQMHEEILSLEQKLKNKHEFKPTHSKGSEHK